MGHVAALELPSQEGRARSPGTRSSAGAHLSKEARFETVGHVTSTGAHLSKETRFGAEGYVVAPELTSVRRRGSGSRDMWRLQSPHLQGDVV
jgi:hypothetical protein